LCRAGPPEIFKSSPCWATSGYPDSRFGVTLSPRHSCCEYGTLPVCSTSGGVFQIWRWRHQAVRDGLFRDFPAFAPALLAGPLEAGAYGFLLNLNSHQAEAVLIVRRCLEAAGDKHKQVGNLLGGSLGDAPIGFVATGLDISNRRPQLVGCVALLMMNPDERPLDALLHAACHPSWASPQLLATAALMDVPDWRRQVEISVLDQGDPQGRCRSVRTARTRLGPPHRPCTL
jgi:hypothetical protein